MGVMNVGIDRELVISEVEDLIEKFSIELSLKLWDLATKIDRKELKEALGDRSFYSRYSEDEMSVEDTYRYLRQKYGTFGHEYASIEESKSIYLLGVCGIKDLLNRQAEVNNA